MRNHTKIRFSDITGNGKFSGKPDLPSEIFFLGGHWPRCWANDVCQEWVFGCGQQERIFVGVGAGHGSIRC